VRSSGRAIAAGILAAAIGAACGLAPAVEPTVHVTAEVLPWGDFSRFHTYRWWLPPMVDSDRRYAERDKRIDWFVRDAVDRELAARGYQPDTAGRPDFVVRYTVNVVEDSTTSFNGYLSYRAEGGGKDMGDALMGFERGTLTIELVDVPSRQVTWRGQATAILEQEAGGKRIAPAVQRMMTNVPARAQ
jgi:uncharacterized protein DUF4136